MRGGIRSGATLRRVVARPKADHGDPGHGSGERNIVEASAVIGLMAEGPIGKIGTGGISKAGAEKIGVESLPAALCCLSRRRTKRKERQVSRSDIADSDCRCKPRHWERCTATPLRQRRRDTSTKPSSERNQGGGGGRNILPGRRAGRRARAAIMGTMWRKRTMSPANRSGTSTRSQTSK